MYKRSALAICAIVCCGVLLTQCINTQNEEAVAEKKLSFQQFAGSASCAGCHKKIYDTHIHTAHHLSSQPANDTTVKGSFEPGKNSFSYSARTQVKMEKRDSGLYQVAYTDGVQKTLHPFDMVIGSGTKGQTFVYGYDYRFYQLPVSYFTAADQWSNSPGYPMMVVFNRPITARCLECHSTYINTVSPPNVEPEAFDAATMIYGIDCEKCHGPAAAHVAYQQQNPTVSTAKYIINPSGFTRQQKLDACALCHGGRLQKTKPPFSFSAGEKLSDYFIMDSTPPNLAVVDVHGNQYGLLRASKCFSVSGTLTCNNCHNPHEKEKGNPAVYSQRCASCHTTGEHGNGKLCGMTDRLGAAITTNCIDCHMPAMPSRAIAVNLPGAEKVVSAYVRSHFISVYPEQTKEFLQKNKSLKQ